MIDYTKETWYIIFIKEQGYSYKDNNHSEEEEGNYYCVRGEKDEEDNTVSCLIKGQTDKYSIDDEKTQNELFY